MEIKKTYLPPPYLYLFLSHSFVGHIQTNLLWTEDMLHILETDKTD